MKKTANKLPDNRYETILQARNATNPAYNIIVLDKGTGLFLLSCLSLELTRKVYHDLFFEVVSVEITEKTIFGSRDKEYINSIGQF